MKGLIINQLEEYEFFFLKKKYKIPDVLSSNVHTTYFSKLNAFEPVMTLRIQNNDKFKDI